LVLIPRPKLSARTVIVLDCILLFLFAAALIRPLYKAKYLDKWASIESTFVADARFLQDHWPHPQWQPLWYGGTRFDFVYPPALRYGTAALAKYVGYIPVKAYHVYTAFFYCLGIAGVYLLVRVGSKSRGAAALAAVACATMSPSLLVLKDFRADAWHFLPVRLGVLTKYGEGPHMTALALIPFALAFAWLAFERHRPAAIAMAAVFAAAVVSNNFYGATALAVFYPIVLWSHWITRQEKRILIPALAIPALAYGLTAFWLVPSYFKVTLENMKYVSEPGTTWSLWVAVVVAIAFAIVTDRLARNRPERAWPVFAAGATVFYTLNVLGNRFFKFRVSGEPMRLVPELDMVWIVAVVTVLLWLWQRPGRLPRIVAVIVVLAAFYTTKGYVRHAWQMFPAGVDYHERVEYKISEWMHRNLPDSRGYPTGSVRFWYDAWHNLAQLGGGSEQGLLNGLVEAAQWEINLGPRPEPSILWLQCFGVDAIYISDSRSQEIYKDVQFPRKFEGKLPLAYDDHEGNSIYRVPRRWMARARVVETAKLNAIQKPRGNDDVEYMGYYAGVLEKGPDSPVTLARLGSDAMRLRARVAPGESIVVQETYDTPWQAWSGGRRLPVRKDAFGQMAIDAPPGEHDILLAFVTPLENTLGRWLTGLTALILVVLLVRRTE
jgi:hypothetical protein